MHRLPILLCLLLTPLALRAHQNTSEDGLLTHFAAGAKPIQAQRWPDLTGAATAEVVGTPAVTQVGPSQALVLDGFTQYLVVATNAAAAPILPKKDLSVAAWVMLSETLPDGGITGFVQDNGNFEKGWLLGYNRRSFTFRLASTGADDGDGVLSTVTGKTPIEPGRWHYVVGTYDGATLRLYVDGKPDGESTVQSGPILYPDKGRYGIGAYLDDDEVRPMEGGLFEVKTYRRALAASEIAAVAARNEGLLAWRSPVNRDFQFLVPPYLQFATSNSITLMAETERPALMTVEYGERQPLKQRISSTEPKTLQTVTLTGLKPFTQYFYRVTSTDASNHVARSEITSFQTLPGSEQAWAFGIIGDTQRNPDITRRCAEGIFALRPNMLIHCGDVVDDGYAKQQWVFDLLVPSSRLFSQVPVFPVIGNHEKNSHWYYDYFHLPDPEYFYTFTCGNAQFFMIDSNKDCSPGSDQHRRLEQALAASKATWKFTAHHHPCFSSDEDDYGDHLKGRPDEPFDWGDTNARKLVPLYEKHGVDIAFAGHIHSYERTWPILEMRINQKKGVRYIVSGGGGGHLESAAPQRSWFSIHVQRGYHYGFASVFDRTIQFKAYDVDGRLFDTFELTKPADR
ncbi:MAG: metallophosphoesterase [Verrucomicrobia bacterium]|nr:metallophosphoesterase [Verrucomicrobiota bacterium]